MYSNKLSLTELFREKIAKLHITLSYLSKQIKNPIILLKATTQTPFKNFIEITVGYTCHDKYMVYYINDQFG